MPIREIRGSNLFPLWCLLMVLGFSSAFGQDAQALRRGSYAAFSAETPLTDAAGATVRTAPAGEVVRIRKIDGTAAEVTSGRPELAGGLAPLAALRSATIEENNAWVANGARSAGLVDQQLVAASTVPPGGEETNLEAAEKPLDSAPAPPAPSSETPGPKFDSPAIGWFSIGGNTTITGLARGVDGSLYVCASATAPITFPGARPWADKPLPAEDSPTVCLIRISPDLKTVSDCVVFGPEEIAGASLLRADPRGGIWLAARAAGLAGSTPDAPTPALLHFSPDLRKLDRALPLLGTARNPADFQIDAGGRPVVLFGSPKRSGGGFLTRYFSTTSYERMWPDWPDGPTRRPPLDFSSASLADGPFGIWSKKSETLPDMPTPIGPWGSPPNAGQPVTWTNVKKGTNPIGGANLKPEALAIDRAGRLVVAGTIPFHMGNPDFDPFLLSFTPEGKLRWTNCFLSGLLSEPDQKTQSLAVDPSNGDLLICYWQHGNNVQTLLLDPNGFLNKWTGTKGNIKISWIGRVDADTGKLKNSTYLYSRIPNPQNPRWPDLNSVDVETLVGDESGRVYAVGGTTITFPTTSNAYLPAVTEFGVHPMLIVLRHDLSAPHYSTYLSPGKGASKFIAVLPGSTAVVAGTHATNGLPLPTSNLANIPFLSETPPAGSTEGAFLAILTPPAEEGIVDWNQ